MNPRHFILFFLTAFALLFLALSATVIMPYVGHDSVRYFHRAFNYIDPHGDLQYQFVHASGRPLAAELEQFLYYNVNHLSDLSFLRLLSIVITALSAAVLAGLAVSAGLSPVAALCLSVAIFTLPGVQESIFVPYLFNTLPILSSLLAYAVWQSRLASGLRLLGAFLLLEAAFFTYPSSTFIFLIPTALTVLYRKAQGGGLFRRWVPDVILWAVAAGFFYAVLKIYYAQRIVLTHHYIDFSWQTIWTHIKAFPNAVTHIFNLWHVYHSVILGVTVMGLVCLCVGLDLVVFKKTWGKQRLAAFLVVFMMVNAVWIMFGGYQPRVYIASQAVAVILLFWSGEWIGQLWKNSEWWSRSWPVALMLTGLVSADLTTTSNVWNNNEELMFLRTRIVESMHQRIDKIYVVVKSGDRGYNGLPTVYDNLNRAMDRHEFVDFVRAAVKDLPDKPPMTVDIVCVQEGEPFEVTANTLVLNMNDLLRASTLREMNLNIRGNI